MAKIFIDLETYSTVDISTGLANYCTGASVLLCAWAIDDKPVQMWDVRSGEPCPVALYDAAKDAANTLLAHNASFDAQLINSTGLFGFPIPLERWYCTMTQALEHNLPASLDNLCTVFKLPSDKAKLKDGRTLVRWFCTPDAQGCFRGVEPADKWLRFREYCVNDVVAMREIHNLMPKANFPLDASHIERILWVETERMNQRGFGVDLALASTAVSTAERVAKASAQDVSDATEGLLSSTTQTAALREHLKTEYQVDLPNMQSATIDKALATDIPQGARFLLEQRAAVSKASVAKYKKLLACSDSRGRMTGTILFCGASGTGRDAGRVFQPQNLPRPAGWFEHDAEGLIADIKAGCLELTHAKPMDVLSSALRGAIVPSQGKKLVVSDLSNIEGRVVVWLAGESWKLSYFSDYDAGKIKFDNYVAAYSKMMGVAPEDVSKDRRNVGKAAELSLGFGSGVSGLLQFLGIYRVDLEQLASATEAAADKALWHEVLRKFDWAQKNKFDYGLPLHQWAACEYIKQQWRSAHGNVAQLWADCEAAFRNAYITPDVWFKAGQHLAYKRRSKWIFCKLPSGRVLSYPNPRITEDGITYMSMDQVTNQWVRTHIYAGKFVAHATQASARDFLLHAMLKAGDLGYTTVMRVHDELITETPDSPAFNDAGLGAILSTPHDWCKGLPLAAAGYETNVRYRKD
jgi:DNA polymerase